MEQFFQRCCHFTFGFNIAHRQRFVEGRLKLGKTCGGALLIAWPLNAVARNDPGFRQADVVRIPFI
jgi:hypothetical protein